MSFLAKKGPQSSQDCGPAFFALWAAGTGSPPGSPYAVGVKEPTENQRNGIVETSVFKTAGSNIRLQRRRGVPQARPSPALPEGSVRENPLDFCPFVFLNAAVK